MPVYVHPDRYSTSNVQTPKQLIVVHTSESSDGSLASLEYLVGQPGDRVIPGSNPPRMFGAAYHALADGATGEYVQLLPGTTGPYANGGANKFAWSICCPGRAAQTRAEWLDPMSRGQILACARFIVDRGRADGIPLVKVTPAQMVAGAKGYCGHIDVTNAYHQSDHTDPGPNFPWDVLASDIANLTHPNLEDLMEVKRRELWDSRDYYKTGPVPAGTPIPIPVPEAKGKSGVAIMLQSVGSLADKPNGFISAGGGLADLLFTAGEPASGLTLVNVNKDAQGNASIAVSATQDTHIIVNLVGLIS